MLEKESYTDYKDYIVDESMLMTAYPDAHPERIRIEREFQASHYIMQKFYEASTSQRDAAIASE